MKYIKYIALIIILAACEEEGQRINPDPPKVAVVTPSNILGMNTQVAACSNLNQWLIGQNPGGYFTQISGPVSVSSQLIGDAPCVDWPECGDYVFTYTSESPNCDNCPPSVTQFTVEVPCCDPELILTGTCTDN